MLPTDSELAEAVAELVRIPSVNPLQGGPKAEAAGPIGERALAEHLARRFREVGASDVVLDEVIDGRPNVYGRFPGRTDRVVVLDVHTDTVAVEHMTDPPFDGRIEDGRVWGRGALDTKASLGVVIALLRSWQQAGVRPAPTLIVVGSVSEESGGLLGATAFRGWAEREGVRIDQMIVAEPTEFAPIHGHKGGVVVEAKVHGVAAHSARPEVGANAIEAMAPVIAAFNAEHQRLQTVPPTTELGTSTISVTLIDGGTGPNIIPAACSITVYQRTVPGQVSKDVFERLAAIAEEASPLPVTCVPTSPPRPEEPYGSDAFYQSADADLVRDLARWAGTTPTVAPFGTNALRYGGFGPEIAVFGPGCIDDAHQATECVAIADLVTTAEVFTRWLDPA